MTTNHNLLHRSQTKFLTGIRGYAALGVIMVHCTSAFKGHNEYVDNLLNFGKYGVVAFFVLSAFSLSISMHTSPPNTKRSLAHYFNRRFWRIMPLYTIVCAIVWTLINFFGSILTPTGANSNSGTDLFMHLSLLNAFYHQYANSIIGVEWTIQLEMMAYLSLPILYYATKKHSWKMGIFITIALFAVGKQESLSELILPADQTFFNHDWSLLKYFFAFYIGTLAFNRIVEAPAPALSMKQSSLISYGLIAFLPIYGTFFPSNENLIVTLWVIGLIYALLNVEGGPRLILENKAILHIGKISFSVYLLHMPLYHLTMPALGAHLHPVPAFVVFLIIVIAASTLTYKVIEEQFMAAGEALFQASQKGQSLTTNLIRR
jgi:peptidoglycan/LPS O-acetylase OafA/YrhL